MSVAVAVDFGTTSTCVAVAVDGQQPQLVVVDGSPLMSSAVYADGYALFVGAEAVRQAAVDPSRYEPTPKRRIDEGSLLLGDTAVPVQRAIAAVLSRAVREARNTVGGRSVDLLVLTHPAEWGHVRVTSLVAAAQGLASAVRTASEPVAAAVQHGSSSPTAATRTAATSTAAWLAVLDVGAGTTDVSVLRFEHGEFTVLATRGDPHFGGADIDEVLLAELGTRLSASQRERWDALVHGHGVEQRRRLRTLLADVRSAKESLSRHAYADVPLPGELPDGHLTRADLERLILHQVTSVVDMLAAALGEARALDEHGTCAAEIFLVGGSSRIPLFAHLIHQRFGVLPVSRDQPETVVARGALRALAPAAVQQAAAEPAAPPAQPESARPREFSAAPARSKTGFARRNWWWVGALVLVGGGVAAGAALWWLSGTTAPQTRVVTLAQSSMVVPAQWQESRRSADGATPQLDLTPDGAPAGDRGLFLVQTVLDPKLTQSDVARALQRQVATEQAAGKQYEAFADAADYAGRGVIHYREVRQDAAVVDWYVLVQSHTQLSVGCQHPAKRPETVSTACHQAVGTVAVTGN